MLLIEIDDPGNAVSAYLDGVKVQDNVPFVWEMGTAWQTIFLGTMGVPAGLTQPPGNRQAGYIALTRIYPFILTDEEVIANMNSVVPEPGTLCLVGLGGLALLRRRR